MVCFIQAYVRPLSVPKLLGFLGAFFGDSQSEFAGKGRQSNEELGPVKHFGGAVCFYFTSVRVSLWDA